MMNRGSPVQKPGKLTLLPFLITAMSRSLADWPMLNATYDDEANVISRHGAVHMGMATQTENGLMVPVIRNAETLGIFQIVARSGGHLEAARSGKASADELMEVDHHHLRALVRWPNSPDPRGRFERLEGRHPRRQ